jgi:O-antigen/teichoic acid export membrane protein
MTARKIGQATALLGRVTHGIDPATRAWSVVVTGNIARLTLGFVASILIARDLGPATYGVFAVLGAVATIGGTVADVGLTDTAVKRIADLWPADPAGARRRGQVFFWLRLGTVTPVVLAACLVVLLLGRRIALPDEFRVLLPLTFVGIAATALSSTMSALLQATGHFRRFAVVMLTNAILSAVLAVVLHLLGHLTIVTALVILGIGTSLAAFAVGYRLLPGGLTLAFPSVRAVRSEAGQLLRFGRWLWVSNVLAMLTTQLDLFLVSHWSTPAAVGAYALALNLASKVNIVNHSLYTVLLPSAAALRGRVALRHYLRQGLVRSGLIGFALLALLPIAGLLITAFYGPAYTAATHLFRLLLGVVIFDLVVTPLLLLPYHYNRPEFLVAADALRVFVLAFIGVWLIPVVGPAGAVAARLGAGVAGAILTLALLARHHQTDDAASSDATA